MPRTHVRYWLYDVNGVYCGNWDSLDELNAYVTYMRAATPHALSDERFAGTIRIEAHIMVRKSYYVNAI